MFDVGHSFDDYFGGGGSFHGDDGFSQPVWLLRGGASDTDGDGTADLDFDEPVEVSVIITAPDAERFEILDTGPEGGTQLDMCAPGEHGITQDDRIVFHDGIERRPYRVIKPRPERYDGDEIVWYRLVEDERGEEIDDPGPVPDEDVTDEPPPEDDPDDTGYGTW